MVVAAGAAVVPVVAAEVAVPEVVAVVEGAAEVSCEGS